MGPFFFRTTLLRINKNVYKKGNRKRCKTQILDIPVKILSFKVVKTAGVYLEINLQNEKLLFNCLLVLV